MPLIPRCSEHSVWTSTPGGWRCDKLCYPLGSWSPPLTVFCLTVWHSEQGRPTVAWWKHKGLSSALSRGGAGPSRIMGCFPLPYGHKWDVDNLPVNRTELLQWMRAEIQEGGPKNTYTLALGHPRIATPPANSHGIPKVCRGSSLRRRDCRLTCKLDSGNGGSSSPPCP